MRFHEPTWYDITEKPLHIGRFPTPLRILHLSDLHDSPECSLEQIEEAIDLALELEADLAFLTGDFITWIISDFQEYARILGKVANRVPAFACVGNHDGGMWAGSSLGYKDLTPITRLLEAAGVTLLFNVEQSIRVQDRAVRIVGLGDLWSGDCRPEGVLERKRTHDEPLFVLSHNPDSKEMLLNYDWDVMFCGHTHGGQLVIPILGLRRFLPVADHSFPEGLWSRGNQHVHITRGVGNLHGMRFNCRPEISILSIT